MIGPGSCYLANTLARVGLARVGLRMVARDLAAAPLPPRLATVRDPGEGAHA